MRHRRPAVIGTLSLAFVCMTMDFSSTSAQAEGRPLSSRQQTNGSAIRRAFEGVVEDANRWTVRVMADGDIVAYGMIVSEDGYILTKASRLGSNVEVRLPNESLLAAEYVGYHPEHDLALLKIEARGLDVVQWQNEDDPAVGRWVITPDQDGAPSAVGVVSVKRREIPAVKVRGVLGIRLDGPNNSATVQEVIAGSAAEVSGIKRGDLIQRVNELDIDTRGTLMDKIAGYSPGDRVVLEVKRGEEALTVEATLTHPFGDFLSRIAMQNQMGGRLSERRTGFPSVLQHDSVLQPDECGGPLVDLSGKAVGLNIARAGRTESYAIPDDVVRQALAQLLTGQYPPPQVRLAGFTVPARSEASVESGGE
ncbi:MAG: PDZ domain-containing protein [Planctomycetaceae bacterium]|nr:PDZ domain-containing protein [Planctomycetaceae bacterium]